MERRTNPGASTLKMYIIWVYYETLLLFYKKTQVSHVCHGILFQEPNPYAGSRLWFRV